MANDTLPYARLLPNDLRYRVFVFEGDYKLLVAACDCVFTAKKLADNKVDDALPRNTVHVIDTTLDREVGYAYLGGDGGSYWHENKD